MISVGQSVKRHVSHLCVILWRNLKCRATHGDLEAHLCEGDSSLEV
jgi:hypothetical protein